MTSKKVTSVQHLIDEFLLKNRNTAIISEKQGYRTQTITGKELALQYISKAEHNLNAFLHNKEGGFYDRTINIGFYAMYHCCLANT